MDPISNPYSPGAGAQPPALVGRDVQLREFEIALQRLALGRPARSFILTGLRGVGKTVLLNQFGQIGRNQSWVHQHLEATDEINLPRAMATLARNAILRLSRRRRLAERAGRALGILKSFQIRWHIPDAGALDIAVDPTVDPIAGWADSGALEVDLADLLVEVGELAQAAEVGVLFTIDEMQYLSKDQLAALIVGLHRISQEQLPLVLAGAGLPSLPALAGEAKSYAERLFKFTVIDRLGWEDALEALASPARREGVVWTDDALRLVVDQSEGYPYFLQEFGNQAWDIAEGPGIIEAEDVEVAIPIATEELDAGFFAVRFDRTTPAEREYLLAMAASGPGPYQSGDIARSMGKQTGQVSPMRDSLIKRGLCYSPSYGVIDFTVPMFDRFVRRRLG